PCHAHGILFTDTKNTKIDRIVNINVSRNPYYSSMKYERYLAFWCISCLGGEMNKWKQSVNQRYGKARERTEVVANRVRLERGPGK
ncbi:unnamed protein product, partial [Gongylonema pulchrum]|uniref:Uncharacterized protein n=1 Tax=Gongylonema pulchrum TaxID=637853 RepID=A0A183D6P9_9BILA